MPTQDGALRVFYQDRYRQGTWPNSLAVRDALASEISADLAPWYRVEASKYDHFQIPHRYGWRILADASAVPDRVRRAGGKPPADLEFEDEEESTAKQVEFEHTRTKAAERPFDVVDGFLEDRTSFYKIALVGQTSTQIGQRNWSLNRWFPSMVEVAKDHSAAKPWRDAFERNPALVAGEREPTFADFDRATSDQWAQTILELAKATRITVNEQLAQERADERKRARNEQLRPHEIKVDDPIAFIIKTYDTTHPVRLDDYGWKGVVEGGQTLTNAKNEQIFLLRVESSGVVYQNLADKKFYKQTLEGFVQELVYGIYASAGQQSLPAAKLAIGMTRGLFEVVGMIFKPAKHALSAVDVINAAFQLKKNRAELERDYQSVKVAYANIDKLLPGLLPKIWRAVLDKQYLTVFNRLEHPDADRRRCGLAANRPTASVSRSRSFSPVPRTQEASQAEGHGFETAWGESPENGRSQGPGLTLPSGCLGRARRGLS